MKVFASKFLEKPTQTEKTTPDQWSWRPNEVVVSKIYASGAPTATQQSTYASEKDSRSDSDRPNEGGHAA